MSEKVFLALGDIIQITAPSNLAIHDHIYLINYLDDNKIKLIDAMSSSEGIEVDLDITDGKLNDESIEEIAILSHPRERGFARQQRLLPETWVDIYFGGDTPNVLTGKIVNLEEDMIEIETSPDKRRIFIDFAYKGIPENLPISQINIRESPLKMVSTSLESDIEESEEVEEVATTGETSASADIAALIQEGDEIIMGEEEYMVQVVDVPEEERRFGISQQSEDLLDEMLASVPTNKRTNAVLNNIHLMIERFKQLRMRYSVFDKYGNPEYPLIKGNDYKPLVKTLTDLTQKLYWILPVVKNKRKLYNIIDGDYQDIIALTLAEVREDIYDIIQQFKQNIAAGDENKYDQFMNNLYPYLVPFVGTTEIENILISKETQYNYDTITNNLEDFTSTAFGVEIIKSMSGRSPPQTHNVRFVIERYIKGLTKLINIGKKTQKSHLKRVNFTPNDTMDIQGFLMLPPPVISYSNINLPNSSILQRAQLHMSKMNYWQMLKANTRIILENISHGKEPLYSLLRHRPVDMKKWDIIMAGHSEEADPGETKYISFLDNMVPTTKNLFLLFRKWIRNGHSYMDIISQLEPFMIYADDISLEPYRAILKTMDHRNVEWRREYSANRQQMERYQNKRYPVGNEPWWQRAHDAFFDAKEFYQIPSDFLSQSEILLKMLQMDGCRVFTIILSLNTLNLHGYGGVESNIERELADVGEKLETEKANNDCKEYILSKRYLEIDEIEADNNKDIYFDKRYDITRYDLLDEMKVRRAEMNDTQFKEFIYAHLQNIGLNPHEIQRESAALLSGKRLILDGDYAILSLEEPTEFQYYIRNNNRWVLDESLGGKDWAEVFCNLQKKCLRVQGECNDMDINKSKIEQELLKEIIGHFDNEIELSQERLQDQLEKNLAFYKEKLSALILLHQQEETKYEIAKLRIGFTYDQKVLRISSYAKLRDLILAQANFPKKQQDIKKFIARFCRIGEGENESPYWYYDAEIGVPLIPTFFKTLADAFEENKYQEALQEVVRERGKLSDSGDAIVDEHSGYEIKKMDYVILEEFNEKGFRLLSRDLLEKNVGDTLVQVDITKKFASKNAQIISNIIKTMERFLTVSFSSQTEFIIKNVTDILDNIIPSRARYEKMQQKKKKKKGDTYTRIKNNALLMLTLCYIILTIQTLVPSPKISRTFPGCKRSFKGYPFDGEGNTDFLTYVSCIIYNIKLEGEPWIGLKRKKKKDVSRDEAKRQNIVALTNNLKKLFQKHILDRADVKDKIKMKHEFLSTQIEKEYIGEEHRITAWTTFLPPLRLIRITNIRNVEPRFVDSLFKYVEGGNIEQFKMLSVIRGKIILYALSIQEAIQRVINKEGVLLKNAADEPFLENVCCNVGSQNTIKYFSTAEPSIQKHNLIVHQLSDIINGIQTLSRAAYLYDPKDTKLVYPPVTGRFTEKTIYKAFIRYCRFKSGLPLSSNLQTICLDNTSAFLITDTFEEKMRILKQEGKHYSLEQFYQLLMIIERQNIVHIDFGLDIISARTRLEALLDHLDERDIQHPLFALYRETLDYVDIQEDEHQEVTDQMSTYLSIASAELIENIYSFIREHTKITGRELQKIKTTLETLSRWDARGEDIYMSKRDETHFFSATFLKNNILKIANIYPAIIEDKVSFENVKIPEYWKFSMNHNKDIQSIISSEFASLRRFYDNPQLVETLHQVSSNARYIIRIINVIPFFARTRDANILFGGEMFNHLMQFYYLSTLHLYITQKGETIILKKKDVAGGPIYASEEESSSLFIKPVMSELDIEEVDIQESDQSIALLLVQYIKNFQKHKKMLNLNNEIIQEKALKSREKEKNKMTRELGYLEPAEREVEDLMKNHRLGKWSIGMTRAIFEYDEAQYERERQEMEKDALMEGQLQQMEGVTPMNQNLYKLDMIEEQNADQAAWKEAYNISDLPDDDDYGERDGDEGF